MLRHLLVTICAVSILACAGHVLFAALAKPAAPRTTKTVITADGCTLKQQGNNLSVSFEKNVKVAGTQNGMPLTLICQRLQADGVQDGLKDATALKPTFTGTIVVPQNGVLTKYRIEIYGASLELNNFTQVTVRGKAGGERAKVLMYPVDRQDGNRVELVAETITFDTAAANAMAAAPKAPFMIASGNASLTAAGTPDGKAAPAYKLIATAARISGKFEQVGDDKQASTHAFYFEKGGEAAGKRPHLEVTSLTPDVPDKMRLDADSLACYPGTFAQVDAVKGTASSTPLIAVKATGHVEFAGTQRQQKETIEISGHGGEVLYRLAKSLATERLYDRYLILRSSEKPAEVTLKRATDPDPWILNVPKIYMNNLDAGKSGVYASEEEAEKVIRGDKP